MKLPCLCVIFVSAAAAAMAADVPGSSDPAGLKRYQGSEIVSYNPRPYDRYVMARGVAGFDKTEEIEGRLTRVIYRVPQGHTSLEILRNYQSALKTAGLAETFVLDKDGLGHAGLSNPFYFQNKPGSAEWDGPMINAAHPIYFTSKGVKDGKNITVAVLAFESTGYNWRVDPKTTLAFKPGEVIVGVDVVESAAVPNKMVLPPADQTKEPAYLKRFQDAELVSYNTRPYDRYVLARGVSGFDKTEQVEGQITRLMYRLPAGHTSFEILKNYESALKDAGFTQTFELAKEGNGHASLSNPFSFQNQAGSGEWDSPVTQTDHIFYVTGKAAKEGKNLTVAVLTLETAYGAPYAWQVDPRTKVTINPGAVLVGVDVVEAKGVEINMAEPKADSMGKTLGSAGTVDLYGIYFDIDRTVIKPESKTTLDEVAKLLKADPALTLEVSGHTDNSGTAARNLALSKGRAAAVVAALVKDYGVAPARLKSAGYGDTKPVAPNTTEENKAKNRRVELRKS